MATSSTSESDSLPVSSECKAQRCYKSQSRQLKNEGDKIFHPLRGWIGKTCLYALPLPVPMPLPNCFLPPCTPPSTFPDPPLPGISRRDSPGVLVPPSLAPEE